MQDSLLIELLTEELPPRSLEKLSLTFAQQVVAELQAQGFIEADSQWTPYATPRRLAVLIPAVRARQPDRILERKGPAVSAGLNAQGEPTPALLGFARSAKVDIAELGRQKDAKGEYFVARIHQEGQPLPTYLADIVAAALKKLPIPKMMRWGDVEVQFVRPVHGLVMLHGAQVVDGTVLGQQSGRQTRGHRFLSQAPITIPAADAYAGVLEQDGQVVASFEQRREMIRTMLGECEAQLEARIYRDRWQAKDFPAATADDAGQAAQDMADRSLLDEVTALVEYPQAYVGSFDAAFLEVPAEVLTLSMKQHQKYFPVTDAAAKLMPRFVVVSNVPTSDPSRIIGGNERVLRARLDDARFFYEQDRKTPLAARVERLAHVVYHNKLGSVLERVERIRHLAGAIAGLLGADVAAAERAAWLCKADLNSEMVGEFPELQGVMGRYYALHDGEPPLVADAIEGHYHPRFAGDSLPQTPVAGSVALADKLDILAGIYGIGLVPTGDKDPFGLRRHALGILRILIETPLPLDLIQLLRLTVARFPQFDSDLALDLYAFMLERLKHYLRDLGYAADEVDAVISQDPARMDQVVPRLEALRAFRQLPEAEALAIANKRTHNILRAEAAQASLADGRPPVAAQMVAPAEKALLAAVSTLAPEVTRLVQAGAYTEALQQMAGIRAPVDTFFDEVMVMDEDLALRRNRLALLQQLSGLLTQVADISRLAG